MEFDRLEVYRAIDFISAVIPQGTKTGKNCLFVRVEGDKLILTGGGEYATKKYEIVSQNTTSENVKLPDKFMIPKADLLAFKAVLKEHKADVKRLPKDDPNYHLVEITGTELISGDSIVEFKQPPFQFKELESLFNVKMSPTSTIPIMRKELVSILHGFKDSEKIEQTNCSDGKIIFFRQGDFEAVLISPVEKEDDKQKTIDE